MRRLPDVYKEEGHAYIKGVFSSMEKAKEASNDEEIWRGGKYSGFIEKHELDFMEDLFIEENKI
jgi:hypothetical protein